MVNYGHFGQLASETQMTLEFNNEIYLGEIYINKLKLNNLKEINMYHFPNIHL
ncbi:MAG: hypothetical protein Ct9H90mP17_4320 [Actinomycetota bacterium]|nr:MAG: hypothetical protein Ct9H90mP17_4320 [Actinomycetota bacterium]